MEYVKVKNLDHLKEILSRDESQDFVISNGFLRSSKLMSYDGVNTFWVLNYIDDSEQQLTEEQLFDFDYTNIGQAITNGCLFWEKVD